MIDKDTFTLSEPPKSWRQWIRQKNRHYTTSKYYKGIHKFLLGLYAFSHFFFYPLFILTLLFANWKWGLAVFGVRLILQGVILLRVTRRLDEKDLFPWYWLLDAWMFFYYLVFSTAFFKKPQKTWK